MFDDILINPRTKRRLQSYLSNPSQPLMLVGPSGAGKHTLGRLVASQLLETAEDKLDEHPYYVLIEQPAGKQEIPIESVREISRALKLRVPGNNRVKRVIFINNAHLMNPQAQNAFLKSLEEPSEATVFIMSAKSASSMLPTITSRTAMVEVDPISVDDAKDFLKSANQAELNSAWALSEGMPGLLVSLSRDSDSDLRKAVNEAKGFLRKTPYERLVELDTIKDKSQLISLLEGLARVLKALYRSAAERQDKRMVEKLTKAVEATINAQNNLELNVSPRLVIMSLVLRLPV